MHQITNIEQCTGCTTCFNTCSMGAISMVPDSLGFLYPRIDTERCIGCDACKMRCPAESQPSFKKQMVQLYYSVRLEDEDILRRSQSGGAFYAISDIVLDKDGVVYGTIISENHKAVLDRATTKVERDKMCGSKYVQSELGHIFHRVKKDLQDNRLVLFSGTPCQVDGLLRFIPTALQINLITVDIFCHGVPSPFMWHDHVRYKERKIGKRIVRTDFRNKNYGWDSYTNSFFTEDGKQYDDRWWSFFMYHKWNMLRESCYNCRYSQMERIGDISIGDHWFSKNEKRRRDNKGISSVIINTSKGLSLFQECKNVYCEEVSIESTLQGALRKPCARDTNRTNLQKDYALQGYDYVLHKYFKPSLKDWKTFVKLYMPVKLFFLIKNFIK